MIVDESAALRAALDRRLKIDRLLAVDPLRAIADPADATGKDAEREAQAGESASGDPTPASRNAAPLPRWSSDALRLQTLANPLAATTQQSTAVRFDMPLLAVATEAIDDAKPALADAAVIAHVVADTALREAATPAARHAIAPDAPLPVFVPLVLHGPAWDGQPMELIVRRERADETLDNPALDHWCGEVAIELPRLGRVAGHLAFSMQGLRVRLDADDEASASTLTASTAELAAAFTGMGLRVSGVSVGRPAADAMRSIAVPQPTSPLPSSSARGLHEERS